MSIKFFGHFSADKYSITITITDPVDQLFKHGRFGDATGITLPDVHGVQES